MNNPTYKRRKFLTTASSVAIGTLLLPNISQIHAARPKMRIAMVGTGSRGLGMWGLEVVRDYNAQVAFVGLCDINKGRVEYAKRSMALNCPVFTNFEEMMKITKPDTLIVCTVDATHDEFIIKGMEMGANIITEKPLTTDEIKCKNILEAEKRTGKKVTVTFNYRYSPHRQKIYELLRQDTIGQVTSVDFHWYLNVHHGADYFRRWHRLREKGGTLLVHKATHHFDLLNWWLDSDPEQVVAFGSQDFYGKNGSFRSTNCRPCPHKTKCEFYKDMSTDKFIKELYFDNEQYDGYLRDGCVFKEDIDIFDKMAVQLHYTNGVNVSYSLTTYSPYEGYRIAFNGTKGRMETWIKETQPWQEEAIDEIQITQNFGKREIITVDNRSTGHNGGHGGGDKRLKDKIFVNPDLEDTFRQSAGTRDGVMSILVGIAARKSIDEKRIVKISELTDIPLQAIRPK